MKTKFFILLAFIFTSLSTTSFSEENATPKKILVGSPIRQKPAILQEFLESLNRLDRKNYTLDYYFIDDNDIAESSQKLESFSNNSDSKCIIFKPEKIINDTKYECNDVTHVWKDVLIWKVAAFKDKIIEYAADNNYDYLFLIDSDIVLHPKTISKLQEANKDILSNIFWTAWQPGTIEQPQVWLYDEYTQYPVIPGIKPTPEDSFNQTLQFYTNLRKPGVYEVGGLGACTLISQNALKKGVSFKKIPNLTFWGEDRHFCIRAGALGIPLFVDTHYPAYHIYREANLSGVPEFIKSTEEKNHTITLSMIVRNEGDRYLKRVLQAAKPYIDNAVIVDDASDDNTVAICEEVLQGVPLKMVRNDRSLFSNEVNLRKLQFEETIKTNPDWILVLDADEIFENAFKDQIKELITNDAIDAYYFRLYDFWDEEHYRDDQYWSAHNYYRPFLIRYKPSMHYDWKETAQHCGRFPSTIMHFAYGLSNLRLKHYGWAKENDRIAKYERYQKLDPNAEYGWKEQYESILDKNPKLVKWQEA